MQWLIGGRRCILFFLFFFSQQKCSQQHRRTALKRTHTPRRENQHRNSLTQDYAFLQPSQITRTQKPLSRHTHQKRINRMEFELYYWGGNFAGRGEYVRLALHLAGVTWRDVGREEGSGKVVEYIRSKQPNGTYPVCFPPILKHNKDGKEIVINQLPAVLLYLGKLYGFMPEPDNALSYARVMQISLTALDALSGAEHAYHPVKRRLCEPSQGSRKNRCYFPGKSFAGLPRYARKSFTHEWWRKRVFCGRQNDYR